jgi:hypothetical protein
MKNLGEKIKIKDYIIIIGVGILLIYLLFGRIHLKVILIGEK